MKVHPFFWGVLAGYVAAVFLPLRASAGVSLRPGNLMGNVGGFAGGNPGTPRGPGFYG
jgi:hypothetical protein